MLLYKLTDEYDQTYNHTQWGEGVTHESTGEHGLCGFGWIHAYTDPLLAVLHNPIHGDFANPHLWEAEGEIGLTDHGMKVGCRKLTTIRRIELPAVTTEQRVRYGILCAMEVCTDATWRRWAENWLSGLDRSKETAAEEAEAARPAAAEAAAWAAWAWAAASAKPLDLIAIARRAVHGDPPNA